MAKPTGWWRLRPHKNDKRGQGERVYVIQHEPDGGVLVSGWRGLKTAKLSPQQFVGATPEPKVEELAGG